jgi:hypothetical protein
VGNLPSPGLAATAAALKAALAEYVVANWAWSNDDFRVEVNGNIHTHSYDHSDAHGVSVALPRVRTLFYMGDWLEFAEGTDWADLGPAGGSPPVADAAAFEWGPMLVDLITQFNPDDPGTVEPPEPVAMPSLLHHVWLPLIVR